MIQMKGEVEGSGELRELLKVKEKELHRLKESSSSDIASLEDKVNKYETR